MEHLTLAQLEAALPDIARAPKARGELVQLVRRPAVNARERLTRATLDEREGLAGDDWKNRPSSRMGNGAANPLMQVTLMCSRVAQLVAQAPERWGLAGDQLYVDLDLSEENLPAGTRLSIGGALLEVTAEPHTGCKKFAERFGADALVFVNGHARRALRLRGLNARIVQGGEVVVGDAVIRLEPRGGARGL